MTKETERQRRTIAGAIIGTETKDGIRIASISEHAYLRMAERGYGASHVKGTYQLADPQPGNEPDTQVYERKGMLVVVDTRLGNLVTVIRRKKKKKGRRKP
jgi:hypothetical protein